MRTQFSSKWWAIPATVLIAIGLVAVAADKPKDPTQPILAPVPVTTAPGGQLLLMREDGYAVLTPEGKELATTRLPKMDFPRDGWLSPDRKRVAYRAPGGVGKNESMGWQVVVRDLDGGQFMTAIDVNAQVLCWSPDGKSLIASCYTTNTKTEHFRIDLIARTVSKLPWPDDLLIVDWRVMERV